MLAERSAAAERQRNHTNLLAENEQLKKENEGLRQELNEARSRSERQQRELDTRTAEATKYQGELDEWKNKLKSLLGTQLE